MNRIGFWWDIKTANIEYYDIQYAAERTISRIGTIEKLNLKQSHQLLNSTHMGVESKLTAKKCFFGKLYDRFSGLFDQT